MMIMLADSEWVDSAQPMSNLLALDQASRTTGYAIFNGDKLIKYGHWTFNDEDIGDRLKQLRAIILSIINEFQIDQIAFEDIQLQAGVGNNVATHKTLAEVFGIIHELSCELNIPYNVVHSQSWKSTCEIKGKTRPEQKRNAQLFIEQQYGIKPTQDESDAICIGIHALTLKQNFQWD